MLAAFILPAIALTTATSLAATYESGVLTNNQPNATTWRTVNFASPFSTAPVVVLGTKTYNDAEAVTTRVRNVTTTSFQYQLDEWDYLDGVHGSESVHYLALEPGTHTLGGVTWRAGRTTSVTNTEQTAAFGITFGAAPVVLAQAESVVNAKALTTRVRNVTTTGFGLKLQAQEGDTATLSGESVGWIAIATGTGTLDGAAFKVAKTGASVTHAWSTLAFGATYRQPLFFAQALTQNGGDPITIRQRNLTNTGAEIFLQEEQSSATETNHAAEDVGYLVLGESLGELRSKLEVGELVHTQTNATTWTPVTFAKTYTTPVVVFGPLTQNNGQPAAVRVRNVTTTGFEYQVDRWDYLGGAHPEETLHYIVGEQGNYVIGGLRWQFNRVTGVTNTAAARTFAEAFTAAPVVLGQVATTAETSAVIERIYNVTSTGFTLKLDEEEAANQTHAGETVHYLAVEKGSGRLVSNQFLFEANATTASVTDAFTAVNFTRKLADAFLLADFQTRNEVDPVVPRQRNLAHNKVDLRAQDEVSLNAETTHAAESAGYLAIAGAVDLDEDGLPDSWEVANGLSPSNATDATLDPDGDGITNINEYAYSTNPNSFDSGGTITVTPLVADGFELEGTAAKFRINRTGGTVPVTVNFTLSGRATITTDYLVQNNSGGALSGGITIGFNAASNDVVIVPVTDSVNEYPETVNLTLSTNSKYVLGSPGVATVNVNDASHIAANEQLFVAFLTKQGSANTFASGIATLYLNGPKNAARVNLSFSGLTSNQTNAYIRYGVTSGVGPELRPTLPIGQVTNETWSLTQVGAITGQDQIEGLFQNGGKWVYLNIGTGNYPAGEITGIFSRQTGSTGFTAPPAPPSLPTLTGDALTRDVARFLTQATYGPTQAEITALVNAINTTHSGNRIAGYNAWIDAQFALDQTKLLDYTQAADAEEWDLRGTSPSNFVNNEEPRHHNRRRAWWLISTKAHDQLRQRVAFALSQILVTSEELTTLRQRHYGLANYYDLLATRADGNYRTLLEEVSKSPIQGKYLSHLQNQKTVLDGQGNVLFSPDENYAREILQLFSIGLVARHPDGTLKLGSDGLPIQTYSNNDITNLARVFTGWSFSKKHGSAGNGYPVEDNTNFFQGNGPAYFQASWTNPLKNFAAYHDTAAKTVLGSNIAAGLNGQQDLTAALDIIFAHPNIAPFISRLLIQRLVTSNPSNGYIYRVAQKFEDNGSGVRGNLKAVVRAILTDYEARSLDVISNVGYGKQKEPIIRYVQLLRAVGATSDIPLTSLSSFGYPAAQLNNFPTGTTRYRFGDTDATLGQTPQAAPSVFNWFLPDFNPGGDVAAAGLVAPELQLSTETSVVRVINYHYTQTHVDNGQNGNPLFGATDALEDNIKLDRTAFVQLYDSEITNGKTVTEALTTVLDQLDVVLTSGNLKERYASAATPNPRSIILEAVSTLPGPPTSAARVKELLYLLVASPEYIHQK
ncbi:hypothetical protein BGE01nite_02810 [Brevifollis gellanilyticus]|uniref:CHRD domain-containing protein n=1 Tax=Brevifollis gellanilyticus TaxID=748831 RepID=A0A512M2N2_9BACT|nr:hypothetical protein BGE01nite_02810 [Brevifollis gellanilyticus]